MAENELNISLGLPGFEDVEARLERLHALLERTAATAERAFKSPSSSAKDFAVDISSLDRQITSLAGRYGSLGRAGAAGFEQITNQQVRSIDRLTVLQSRLRDIDKERSGSPNAATKSGLIKDFEVLQAEVTKLERSLYSLQTFDVAAKLRGRLTSENAGEKVTFSGPASVYSRTPDKALEAALVDTARYQAQRKKWDEDYTNHVNKEADKQYKIRTTTFRNYVSDVLTGLKRVGAEETKASTGLGGRAIGRSSRGLAHDFLSEIGLGGLSGALGPAAIIGSIVIGLEKFYQVSSIAIERASEQARANRTLASSASEAGVSVGFLTQKNKQFAEQTAISDVKAASTVAKITQLATLSQRPGNIDKLVSGFANLGAARGLDPLGIETVVQQIITGQDEGYKKLLLPNPQQLQRQFIKENPQLGIKSVADLSSVQRAQIFQDAFLKKAELFNGAAEARLQSLDGKAAKLNASFENLANTLSTTFAGSYDTQVVISVITKYFNEGTDAAKQKDLVSKALRGESIDKDIKNLSLGSEPVGQVEAILHYAAGGVYSLAGSLQNKDSYINKIAQDQFEEARKAAKIGGGGTDEDKEKFYKENIDAEIRFRKTLEKVGLERRIQIATDIAQEEKERLATIEKEKIGEIFSDRQRTIESVTEELTKIKDYTAPEAKTIDQAKLTEAVNKEYDTTAPDQLKERFGNLNEAQIKEKIKEQLTKEFQATVDVENSPLFDEKTHDQLIKQGTEILSDVVEQVYKRTEQRLRDPKTKLIDLKAILANVEKDARLLKTSAEDLIFQLQSEISKTAENNFEKEFKKYQKPQGTLAQVRSELTRVKGNKDLLPDDKASLTDTLSDFIEDSIYRGKQKVKELGKQYRDEVYTVFSAKAEDNPIARLFIEGEQAIIKLKDSLAGLSPDITSKLLGFQQNANDLKVFKQSLTDVTTSFDLLKEARQFHTGRLDSDRSKSFQRAQLRRDLDEEIRELGNVQFKGTTNAEQRTRAINQAIIQITRGADPRYLSANERVVAEQARRSEASNVLNDFKSAQDQQKLLLDTQQALTAEVQKLNKLAEQGGIQLIIKIENDAKNANVTATPNISGVSNKYGNDD